MGQQRARGLIPAQHRRRDSETVRKTDNDIRPFWVIVLVGHAPAHG